MNRLATLVIVVLWIAAFPACVAVSVPLYDQMNALPPDREGAVEVSDKNNVPANFTLAFIPEGRPEQIHLVPAASLARYFERSPEGTLEIPASNLDKVNASLGRLPEQSSRIELLESSSEGQTLRLDTEDSVGVGASVTFRTVWYRVLPGGRDWQPLAVRNREGNVLGPLALGCLLVFGTVGFLHRAIRRRSNQIQSPAG